MPALLSRSHERASRGDSAAADVFGPALEAEKAASATTSPSAAKAAAAADPACDHKSMLKRELSCGERISAWATERLTGNKTARNPARASAHGTALSWCGVGCGALEVRCALLGAISRELA